MVTLTLQDKKTLMEMLRKHYTIEESAFIKAIAQNEEEEVELTLKAFSLSAKSKVAVQQVKEEDAEPDFKIVQINQLNNPLYLVKAVKEKTGWSLANSKHFVDSLQNRFNDGSKVWLPFKVGDTPDCKFTIGLWANILEYMDVITKDTDVIFKLRYV